jgi:glycosyltransferase involved in cell wall biosynthesis
LGVGIQRSIEQSAVQSAEAEPAWRELPLLIGAGLAMVVPLALAAALGRTLDERSFAGFALVLALSLAVPVYWLLAAGEARPAWWVGAGLIALVAMQVVDVAAVWWREPGQEGAYAAASSLAWSVFLLEIVVVSGPDFARIRARGGLPTLLVRSLPAVAFLLLVEVAPGRCLSFVYGTAYSDAVPMLRLLAPAMLMAAATLAAIRILLEAGRISWVSSVLPMAAVGLSVCAAVAGSAAGLAGAVLCLHVLVLLAMGIHLLRALVPTRGDGSVLFLAWRDRRHPEGGGSEVYVEEIARRLASGPHGRRVTIFAAAGGQAPRDEEREGVRFVRRGGRITVYLWAAVHHLAGRLRDHDVVVDVQNGVPFFSPLYCSRAVVVLVHHVHREQWPVVFPERRARFGWWVESRLAPSLYSRATYVAVSEATKAELAGLGVAADRIHVIHNGVDRPAGPARGGETTNPSIVYLGRLVPHKRVEMLLEAFASLRGRIPGLALDIAGQGWWEARLRRRVEELGLEDEVRFLGWVDEDEKAALLARSWLLAMPSIKEGWGLAVLEAAAEGTPAVGFRTGGLAESIQNWKTGLVVEDPDGFRDALERLLTDASLRHRLGRQAAERARRFDWNASAQAFDAVLRDLEERLELASVTGVATVRA